MALSEIILRLNFPKFKSVFNGTVFNGTKSVDFVFSMTPGASPILGKLDCKRADVLYIRIDEVL